MLTKKIVTLNTELLETLKIFIDNKVEVIRINFSHIRNQSDMKNLEKAIKEYEKLIKNQPVNSFLGFDTHGPEIRTINSLQFIKEEEIFFTTKNYEILGSENDKYQPTKTLKLSLNKLPEISQSEIISIGNYKFIVKEIKEDKIVTKSLCEGDIKKNKSVTIPNFYGNLTSEEYLSKEDEKVLELAISYNIPYIFLSFIQRNKDIEVVKSFLKRKNENYRPVLISKIEDSVGIKNVKEILTSCDGIMIARGDLFSNLKIENSFSGYKYLLSLRDLFRDKIFIAATSYCEGFSENKINRSAICDIGNAVLDNVDAFMIDETAVGNVKNILKNFDKIVQDAENFQYLNFSSISEFYGTQVLKEDKKEKNILRRGFFFK